MIINIMKKTKKISRLLMENKTLVALSVTSILLFVALAASLINSYWFLYGPVSSTEAEIIFEDKNFENEIRKAVNVPFSPIYPSDLETLKSLQIENVSIESIEGIQYCISLENLKIEHAGLYDIELVSSLENLKTISLKGNLLEDIKPLKNCSFLEVVDISHNYLVDISPLLDLPRLEELNASSNSLTNVTLKNTASKALLDVDLSYNRISNTGSLDGVKQLAILNLRGNRISEIAPFEASDGLLELYLGYNSISNINTLGKLPSLVCLDLTSTLISDISFVSQYPTIVDLYISDTEVSSLEPLSSLTELESLSMQRTHITDLKPLETLPSFCEIYLDRNFDRSKVNFLADHFRTGDRYTKLYILDLKHALQAKN